MKRKVTSHIVLFFLILIAINCTQPIILKNMSIDGPGYFMFGKIPERNFFNDEAITENLELIWTNNTNGSHSHSSIVIYNNHLFIVDLSGRISVFDRTNGKIIGFEKFNGEISAAPIIYKLRVFFVLNEKEEVYSRFIVFDLINGKILSEDKIEGSVTNEMIKLDDGIVVTSERGEVIKYDYVGTRQWTTKTKSTVLSSPCSNEKFIFCGNQNGELIFLESDNGEIVFREKITAPIESGLTFDEGVLYIGDNNGTITAFDVNKKNTVWKYETGSKIKAIPVFDSEKLIVGNLSGKIFAFDKKSGIKKWMLDTKGVINTTPLLTTTYLIQPDFNKKLYMINPLMGVIVKTYEYERRMKLSPVLYDGLLYIGSDRGKIFTYQINYAE